MTDRIEQLKRMLEAEPDDPFCLYSIAQEYGKRGDHEQAVEWYDRALKADPHYHYAYYHKAKALEATEQLDAARSSLQVGIEHARAKGEQKALNELMAFLDELE